MVKAVYKIDWMESERGWGQRPDGVSYCISKKRAFEELKKNNDRYPNNYVPDVYVYGSEPQLVEVEDSLYDEVQLHGCVNK